MYNISMKVDLHVHIKRTSNCAKQEPEEAALKAKELGLDGLVFLDHHYFPTLQECQKAQEMTGVKIFRGTEITVKAVDSNAICGTKGGANDIIIISSEPPDFAYGAYHQPISTNQLPALINFAKRTNALTILAHPFRKDKPLVIDLDQFPIDCIEISSSNTSLSNRAQILDVAHKYNIICVSTSDAHKPRNLGRNFIELEQDVNNEIELATVVRERKFSLWETRLVQIQLP